MVVRRGDGRPGGDGGKSILPCRCYKGEGEESVRCHLMRGDEAACVALHFGYSRAAANGQQRHMAQQH
jgi:hypothetical protein